MQYLTLHVNLWPLFQVSCLFVPPPSLLSSTALHRLKLYAFSCWTLLLTDNLRRVWPTWVVLWVSSLVSLSPDLCWIGVLFGCPSAIKECTNPSLDLYLWSACYLVCSDMLGGQVCTVWVLFSRKPTRSRFDVSWKLTRHALDWSCCVYHVRSTTRFSESLLIFFPLQNA